jgi:hypothetical protein
MEREATEETDGAVAIAATTLGALGVAEPREGDEVDLVVPFKIDLDGEICVRMAQALVKYLLYLRGQIPWCGPVAPAGHRHRLTGLAVVS